MFVRGEKFLICSFECPTTKERKRGLHNFGMYKLRANFNNFSGLELISNFVLTKSLIQFSD